MQVTWTDVGGETYYTVERCLQSGRGCVFQPLAPNVAANTTQYVDALPGGAPSGVYAYRVKACSAIGCSAGAVTGNVVVP